MEKKTTVVSLTKNGSFEKNVACSQMVLPDGSLLIGQKLMENAKFDKFKCNISDLPKFIGSNSFAIEYLNLY